MYMCWCATAAAAAHARSVQRGTSLWPISPAISRILEQVQNIINKNALAHSLACCTSLLLLVDRHVWCSPSLIEYVRATSTKRDFN
jgi:hypothetical protein